MSTHMMENYKISTPKPSWFTGERYDYCEPFINDSSFKKAIQKGVLLMRLFRSGAVKKAL